MEIPEALERYEKSVSLWRDIYDKSTSDIKFVYDIDEGQWPEDVKDARENRPKITVNKLLKFIRHSRSDFSANKPALKVLPVDDKGDVMKAEIYQKLIRQIEYISSADIAYASAYAQAVAGSIGFFRLTTEYVDDGWDQEIKIKRILNPTSVHYDHGNEFTLEDADFCFVEDSLSKEEFETRYPSASVVDFDGSSKYGHWFAENRVRVAEFFWKEYTRKEKVLLSNGEEAWLGKGVKKAIKDAGLEIIKQRTVESHKIMWQKMNGHEILEEPREWPGKYIPVIPMLGDEIVVDGEKHYLSLARGAKDIARMYNYWADLCLKTPIATPKGWATIGELDIGDFVFDELGKQCCVVGVSPVLNKEKSYKITFSDKSTIIASTDHLWTVEEKQIRQRPDYKTTWEKKTIPTEKLSIKNHRISLPKPIETPHKKLPIPPYVLGLWLADGDCKRAKIFAHKKTVGELSDILRLEGMDLRCGLICKASETYGMALLGIRKEFAKLKLLENKHIPLQYLRASFKQRAALLQGLMDGDGSNRKNSRQCRFAAAKLNLAIEFSELLISLGIKGNFNKEADGMYCFSFTPYFPVFRLQYKKDRQVSIRNENKSQTEYYRIVNIKEIEPVPTKCITVDSKSHLFLAGESMIPTHNTAATENVALSPKAPYVVDHRQIKGFEPEWEEANAKNRMFIRYNALANISKPQREPQSGVPAAIMNMMQITAYDIEDHLGMYNASKGAPGKERSGVAIERQVEQSNKGSFTFLDNSVRALIYAGKQLIDLIPKVYDTERSLRLRDDVGNEELVTVNRRVLNDMGEIGVENDLSVGRYDMVVSVHNASATRRTEMVAAMEQAMQYAPNVAHIIAPLMFKYSDWPGANEIYEEIQRELERQRASVPQGNANTIV